MYFQCLFLLMQSTGGRSASEVGFRGSTSSEAGLFAFFFFFLFFDSAGSGGLLSWVGDESGEGGERQAWTPFGGMSTVMDVWCWRVLANPCQNRHANEEDGFHGTD